MQLGTFIEKKGQLFFIKNVRLRDVPNRGNRGHGSKIMVMLISGVLVLAYPLLGVIFGLVVLFGRNFRS